MTDKQIIIDGVDVSGCPYYIDSDGSCSSHDCECVKCVHNVCLYKDYKAKEQECEELKIYIESNEQQVKEVETLVMDNDRLINELDQLKAENDELKDLNTRLDNQRETYWKEYQKLKQTLAEIKPILEFYANSKMGEEQPDKTYKIMLSSGYIMAYDPKPARQALQKISECEVGDDN